MTSLVLGLALAAPAQPPAYPLYPPRVVPLPQAYPAPPGVAARVYLPGPPAPVPPGPPVLTLDQFSRVFTPTPGTHHVWLVHPKTRRPVEVCFTLPDCGKLKRFEVGGRWIEFEFAKPNRDIEINFRHNGTVEVEYDD